MEVASPQPASTPLNPPAVRRFALFVTEGEPRRFLWRLRDEGVSLTGDGIEWRIDGESRTRRYGEIESVHLSTAHIVRQGSIYQCVIRFRNGPPLQLLSASASGLPDAAREQPYRDFIQTLHARLAAPEFSDVRFNAGASAGKALGMKITIGIAAAFFVVLPLVLLFVMPSFELLGIIGVSAALVWPLWRMAKANEPRSYAARDLPRQLLP